MDQDNFNKQVAEFFMLLEQIEESDSGRPFHPVTISSCRVMLTPVLNNTLREMRKYLQDNEYLSEQFTLQDYRKKWELDF